MEAILISLLLLAGLILYVSAVVDVHRYKFPSLREKSIWVTIVQVVPIVGPILYFVLYKRKRPNTQRNTISQ
jgi:multisubunit Na+/H+ antiporter MnhG subunit